ncbi:MAG: crotonase/enoyl-CoA hydratase family protein [Pirellulales bacterium]
MPNAYETIIYEVRNSVLTVTLNRPEKLNAFNTAMGPEVVDAIARANDDDEVRAIIFTGAGRAFCAGADLSKGAQSFAALARDEEQTGSGESADSGGKVSLALYDCKKPLIAAINGPAVGIGVTMTLPMDIRLASDQAKFGFVFTRRGIVPEACSSWFLPRVVGIGQAAEWVLTGRIFDAAEALQGGLVSRVLPGGELLSAAETLAQEMVQHSSAVSVALSRQMLWKMLGESHPREAHRIESQGVYHMGRSPDAREGVQSFLEKRPPKFTMRPSRDMPPFYPWWK